MSSSTLRRFIKTALIPVGHTMYVYGGGWDETDTEASEVARSIGENKKWREFSLAQGPFYDYKNYLYRSSSGLDCTGYIGWCIYNLFHNENNHPGFVFKSGVLGEELHSLGLGSVIKAENLQKRRCGDIFYSKIHSHAYICIGQCEDKSVVLLHASPPGVMVSGTKTPDNKDSSAISIAKHFMREYYPNWINLYPDISRGAEYLSDYNCFRFYNTLVSDPDDLSLLSPVDVLWSLV